MEGSPGQIWHIHQNQLHLKGKFGTSSSDQPDSCHLQVPWYLGWSRTHQRTLIILQWKFWVYERTVWSQTICNVGTIQVLIRFAGQTGWDCTGSRSQDMSMCHNMWFASLKNPQDEEGNISVEGNQEISTPISRAIVPTVWKDRSFCEGLSVHQF